MFFKSIRSFFALRRFRNSSGATWDISELIPYFIKNKGVNLSYKYNATICHSSIRYTEKPPDCRMFYFDAPYGIILHCSKGEISIPLGCLTFKDIGSKVIQIEQLQGPSYEKEKNKDDRLAADLNAIRVLPRT